MSSSIAVSSNLNVVHSTHVKDLGALSMRKCHRSRLVGGTRLVVFPRFLTPYRPKNTTSRDPYPPSSRDPPSGRDPSPPSAPLRQGARGKGSRLERGSRLVAFSNCGRFGRGNTTSRVPPTSRDPLPLLSQGQCSESPIFSRSSSKITFLARGVCVCVCLFLFVWGLS